MLVIVRLGVHRTPGNAEKREGHISPAVADNELDRYNSFNSDCVPTVLATQGPRPSLVDWK